MKTSFLIPICLLMNCLVLVRAQGVEPMAYQDSQKNISCEEAARNAPKIKVGMKKSEVLELLGSPSERTEDKWDYNFTACARPPRAGEQIITGLSILFRAGTVRDLHWGWVDATGPGSPPAGKTPHQKKKRHAS
jgi:outer membrane protein assembly factor BamE (lipoprotein component of BamABCDE complex)